MQVLADVGEVLSLPGNAWELRGNACQLQAAHWDGDGDLDLLVFNSDKQGKALYLEQAGAPNSSNWRFVLRMEAENPVRRALLATWTYVH